VPGVSATAPAGATAAKMIAAPRDAAGDGRPSPRRRRAARLRQDPRFASGQFPRQGRGYQDALPQRPVRQRGDEFVEGQRRDAKAGGGTGMPARVSAPRFAPLPPTRDRSADSMSAKETVDPS